MVAMHDYYYCILTVASYYNTRTQCLPKEPLTNFRANLEEISGPGSWSSAIWSTTSRADTLLQDNEFLSISILLYDIFAFFSIDKILKNSLCGAVHFFLVYKCIKFLCRSHY